MDEAIDFIKNQIKIKSKEKLIVAVSGGPDSMCLLSLLIKLFNSSQIVCAHVNHNIRKESKGEAEFLKNFCISNEIIFEYNEIKKYSKDNFHNDARNQRYQFFDNLVKKYNSKYLLTAHHADDLIETIVMRLIRGSSIGGYKGFSRISCDDIKYTIRPLINITKKEIFDYCNINNIKYVTDKSNFSNKYTRNRIRNNILPVLKEENINVHKKFIEFSNEIENTYKYINIVATSKIKKICVNNSINIEKFNKEDIVIRKEIINILLKKIYKDKISVVDNKNVYDIIYIANSKKANSNLNLPQNVVVKKEYNNLEICQKKEYNSYRYLLDKKVELPNGRIIELSKEIIDNSNNICLLNSKELKMPLFVRNKKNGDNIELLNTEGSQKIKNIFIDKKISLSERKTWPIVTDSEDKVLWVPGLKKSKYDKSKTNNYDIIIWYY